MYRRIVLAVDPEGLAESVLPIVAALARRGGGEVFVIGAAKADDPPEQRAALEKHVREASGELNAAGVTAHGEVRQVAEDSSTATLKLTHKAIGVEVRRGTYDIVVDGQRAGSLEMNDTIEIPIEPGRHTLQIRSGRNSSRTQTFEAAESQTVAFRCTGKSILPIFLASFVVPSLALQLRRVADDRYL